ncbi:hypothetical protein DJ322_RS23245 [Vibrio alginolyticus]|jgi:hypothetical protein|uniref:hypothetical protein n=1 Tax=Vibrio sp. 2-1(7) TaxID=2591011 RepID=UPI0014833C6A|nr:hypothetical protein [Vibrio sp. 2-1(7)]EJG0029092.1 hypothetical protein [Vibrio alginolyticus]NNN64426.1 hypothetical protein [Vibrio sp. 2-1(7)]
MLRFDATKRRAISRTPEEQERKNRIHRRSRAMMLAAKELKQANADGRTEIREIIHQMKVLQSLPDSDENVAQFEMLARRIEKIRSARDFEKIRTIGRKVTF